MSDNPGWRFIGPYPNKYQAKDSVLFYHKHGRLRGAEPQQPATPRAQAPETDIPNQIRKLAELRDQGILTSAEFETKKTELLSRL